MLGRTGRFQTETPEWLVKADAVYQELAGKTVFSARARILELLAEHAASSGDPRPIEHPVKYYEKGDRPLEIVSSRQWYIRNGAEDDSIRDRMLANATALQWHPEFMRARLEHWIEGLNSDWLISRQRFFGVPFPVWYPLGSDGEPDWDHPILPSAAQLPIDPQADTPDGYTPAQRGEPNGFIGDPDVMDTWATSSLSPQIVCGWQRDADLYARTFPMDLRPQGPEIIRTWTFATMLRSLLEHDSLPWASISINGWILDPDRKKMSKSSGNGMVPTDLIEEFGADGLRYWSCHAGQGVDTAVDRGQMKVGRRLATKLLNVSRFVLGLLPRRRRPRRRADAGRRGHVAASCTRSPSRPKPTSSATTTARRWKAPRTSSGSSATTTSSWSRLAPTARPSTRLRPIWPWSWDCRCCSGCSRRSCRSWPKRSGPGGRTGSVHRAAFPGANSELGARAGQAGSWLPEPTCWMSPPKPCGLSGGPRPNVSSACGPRWRRCW